MVADVVEDWEYEIAQILGIPDLDKSKNDNEDELFDLLELTNERLMKYYHYLEKRLVFPFRASFEMETGPLSITEYDVNCIRLDKEMEADEFYGMLVETRHGRKKRIVALAEIEVEKSNPNSVFIDLYQKWFWNYRS